MCANLSSMIEIDIPAIGERIAKYRKLNGISGEQLVQLVGDPVTRSVLAKIENGRRADLEVSVVFGIAWALGVSPLALLLPIDEPNRTVIAGGNAVRVRDLCDWAAGWPATGPVQGRVVTPAGLRTSQILLGTRTLLRRGQELDDVEADFERAAAEEWAPDAVAGLRSKRDRLAEAFDETREAVRALGVSFEPYDLGLIFDDAEAPEPARAEAQELKR